EAVAHDSYRCGCDLLFGQDILEKEANVRNAACDGRFGSRRSVFGSFRVWSSERGCDEFGVVQSGDDVAMAGQVIRQEGVASPAAGAARMRKKDDRANSNRFYRTPDGPGEVAVADGVERLPARLTDGKSARDKWVVHRLADDTCRHAKTP